MDDGFKLGLLVGLAVGCFFVAPIAGLVISQNYRNDAVQRHKAEYYLDEDHNKQWRWLP